MKNRIISRIAMAVLSVAMVFTMMPLSPDTVVYAEGSTPAILVGSDILGEGANTVNAATVRFGSINAEGKIWRVIDTDGQDPVVGRSGTITLLLDQAADNLAFSDVNNNQYKDSRLKSYLENWLPSGTADVFTAEEAAVLAPRTLEGGGGEYGTDTYDANKIAGDTVEDALIWPLSAAEAKKVDEELRKCNESWWLRTPGENPDNQHYVANVIFSDGEVDESGSSPYSGDATTYLYARPAISIDKEEILLTSAALGGKKSGAVGADSLTSVGTNDGGTWKLTIHDSTRDGFTAELGDSAKTDADEGYDNWSLPIDYSGADSNDYVSALLCDADGNALYYGHIAQGSETSTATVNLPTGLAQGGYTLYVFEEDCRDDAMTDHASAFTAFELHVQPSSAWDEDSSLPTESGAYYLTKDVTADLLVPAGQDITIDLNGKTVTGRITVGDGSGTAKLTIKDGRTGGKITCAGTDGVVVNYNSEFALEGGTIAGSETSGFGIYIKGGSVTIDGGQVTSKLYAINMEQGTLNVNGGELSAVSDGIFSTDGATVTISGGTVTGSEHSLSLNSGTLTVTGGSFGGAVETQGSVNGAVKGGRYAIRPADSLIASGYRIVEKEDGDYHYAVKPCPTSVELNKTEITLTDGETEQLAATVLPEDAFDKSVTWASSDEEIATVSEDGTVCGISEGTAAITATTVDGGLTATCTVTVNASHNVWWMVDGDNVLHLRSGMAEGYTLFDETAQQQSRTTVYDNGPWGRDITGVFVENKICPVDMSGWFQHAENLTTITNPENIDTSSVTTMQRLFGDCVNLGSDGATIDLSSWDTSQVTNMDRLFYDCPKLKRLDITGWDTSKVTTMKYMFGICSGLEALDLTGFDTSSVTDTSQMFISCKALKTLDLTSFDMSKVTNKDEMFKSCSGLETIYVKDGADWGTEGTDVFDGCTKLKGQNGTTYDAGKVSGEYARLDGGPDSAAPGYFTGVFVVTFEDGQGNVIGTPQQLRFGEPIVAPEDPERAGYQFDGWDQEFDTARESMTIKATWIKRITVSFDAGGGAGTMGSVETLPGDFALPDCGFTRTGYVFQGWKLGKITYAAEADGTMDCSVALDGDATFTAVWVKCDHPKGMSSKVTAATLSKNGTITRTCAVCGQVEKTTIYAPKTFTLSAKTYTYNGKVRKPTVKVTDAKGKVIAATNYTVTYAKGCKTAGKYTAKVTFKKGGNYTGTKTLSFTINPKKAVISKAVPGKKQIKVTMSTKVSATGGSTYQIKYRVKGASKWKTVTTTSKTRTIKNLKKGKVYQVKVRAYKKVNGKTYYGKWSKITTTKKVK